MYIPFSHLALRNRSVIRHFWSFMKLDGEGGNKAKQNKMLTMRNCLSLRANWPWYHGQILRQVGRGGEGDLQALDGLGKPTGRTMQHRMTRDPKLKIQQDCIVGGTPAWGWRRQKMSFVLRARKRARPLIGIQTWLMGVLSGCDGICQPVVMLTDLLEFANHIT